MKDIRDYLPKKEQMTNLQVKMPLGLVEQVRLEMKDDNVETWQEFFTACFRSYLENKSGRRNESINSILSSVSRTK